jgi:hypothetical protein
MNLRYPVLAFGLAAGLLGACGSSTNNPSPDSSVGASSIEIFSWWVAPGEAEALQAVLQDPGEGWGYVDSATSNKISTDVALYNFASTRADPNAITALYDFFLTKAKKL